MSPFRDMRQEREHWIELTDFHIWQILKIIEHEPKAIRQIVTEGYSGSCFTLEKTVNQIISYGLVTEKRFNVWPFKRMIKITERGKKVLGLYDRLGNIVGEIKKEIERIA